MKYILIAGLVVILSAKQGYAAGDAANGKRLAQYQCAICHGVDGVSRLPDSPNLSGQIEFYLASQLRHYRSGERNHPQMNIISQNLSDQDIADLAAWYSSIQVQITVPE